jgi:hypothetical protein
LIRAATLRELLAEIQCGLCPDAWSAQRLKQQMYCEAEGIPLKSAQQLATKFRVFYVNSRKKMPD